MQNNELPIIDSVIKLYKQFYCYRKNFPKQDRYLLGAKCEQYLIEVIEILLKAKFLSRYEKLKIIAIANQKFDFLKVFIRLLFELKIVDQKKYLILQKLIQETGKMFGGWIKDLNGKQNEK